MDDLALEFPASWGEVLPFDQGAIERLDRRLATNFLGLEV
jgi:hypothetical protein